MEANNGIRQPQFWNAAKWAEKRQLQPGLANAASWPIQEKGKGTTYHRTWTDGMTARKKNKIGRGNNKKALGEGKTLLSQKT